MPIVWQNSNIANHLLRIQGKDVTTIRTKPAQANHPQTIDVLVENSISLPIQHHFATSHQHMHERGERELDIPQKAV